MTSPIFSLLTLLPLLAPQDEVATKTPSRITLDEARTLELTIQDVHALAVRTTVGLYARGRNDAPRGEGASGVVVTADGYVLTAAHVLSSIGDNPLVLLPDGRLVDAVSLGRDTRTDFGLLKLAGDHEWEHAELGESAALTLHEVCLMYGHPDGIETGRPPVLRIGTYRGVRRDGFLQTSCKMMPGDSGGPVFNLDGKVVGINSQIMQPLDRNFHVSVDPVRDQWQRLIDDERWRTRRRGRGGRTSTTAPAFVAGPHAIDGGIAELRTVFTGTAGILEHTLLTLRDEEGSQSSGVVVGPEGQILTKASRLSGDIVHATLPDGSELIGTVLARDAETDLALVQLSTFEGLTALAFDEVTVPEPGALLASVGVGGEVLWVGAVGAPARDVPFRSWGVLGVRFDRDESDGQIQIEQSIPELPAYRAGLRTGDIVLAMDGLEYSIGNELRNALRKTEPGQRIAMRIRDGEGEEQVLEFELGSSSDRTTTGGNRGRRHAAYKTEVSRRRGGFPSALRHDMPLELNQCGSVVVDLHGQVVAVNLSRHDRTGSLALPLAVVADALERLNASVGDE